MKALADSPKTALFIVIVATLSWLIWSQREVKVELLHESDLGVEAFSEYDQPSLQKKVVVKSPDRESTPEAVTQESTEQPDESSEGDKYEESTRLTLDRSLELAFATSAVFERIHSELNQGVTAEFPMAYGTLVDIGINEQGLHQISYISEDGASVNQWYENDVLVAEEIIYEDSDTILTRWYKADSQTLERISYTDGDRAGQIEFDASAHPSAIGFQDGAKLLRFNIED